MVIGIGFTALIAGSLVSIDEGLFLPMGPAAVIHAGVRFARDARTAISIYVDYQRCFRQSDVSSDDIKATHLRSAVKLKDLFFLNSGVYIKIGQHMTQLQHLLPEEYVSTMHVMLDCAPQSSFSDVRRVIEEDLGHPLEKIFENFDPIPIASASLAQVHVATLKNDLDCKVAVKVQHPGLRETCATDILVIRGFINLLYWMYPRLDYRWLAEEAEQNIPVELDFENEGKNSMKFAELFSEMKNIKVPMVFWSHTSKRVLTMSFEEGFKVTDLEKLKENGICPSKVARLVSTVFCKQIFLHGFVHCDPHPGNVLVRKAKRSWYHFFAPNEPELVILDHGLYRELDNDFRLDYARLWKSIVEVDIDGIKTYSESMNAGHVYPLFASMLTHRPWDKILASDLKVQDIQIEDSTIESKAQLQRYAQEYALEITDILALVPRPLLLLLKTNDVLRGIDLHLGSPINTFSLMSKYCSKAIYEESLIRYGFWQMQGHVNYMIDLFSVEMRIIALQILKLYRGYFYQKLS